MNFMSKLIDSRKNVQLIFMNGLLKCARILIATISAITQGPFNDFHKKIRIARNIEGVVDRGRKNIIATNPGKRTSPEY